MKEINIHLETQMKMNQKTIKLQLTQEDFFGIRKFILDHRRPKLSSDFADFMTKKIQTKFNVNCWLKNDFNYISSKNNTEYMKIWSGRYKCIDQMCTNIFCIYIESYSSIKTAKIGELTMKYEEKNFHDKCLVKTLRCHGNKRKEQTNELVQNGITNTRNTNMIENKRSTICYKNFNYSFVMCNR